MNRAKVTAEDYIQFALATPKVVSATEAARVSTAHPKRPAHDASRRLLMRLEPTSAELWQEVQPLIRPTDGVLIRDDSTLDIRMPGSCLWSGCIGSASITASSMASIS